MNHARTLMKVQMRGFTVSADIDSTKQSIRMNPSVEEKMSYTSARYVYT